MSLTVTIRCQACGNEEKTLDADSVWLKYPVPCAIEGGCQKCHKDELYLIEVGGTLSTPQAVSVSFTAPLLPSAKALLQEWLAPFPLSCPECGWHHKSDMFKLGSKGFACMKCGYILQESDMWPEIISE